MDSLFICLFVPLESISFAKECCSEYWQMEGKVYDSKIEFIQVP